MTSARGSAARRSPRPGPPRRSGIAETAERTGVSAHTLRYYERIGLLRVGRDAAGQRRYAAEDFARVVFISRLRTTGMPMRDLCRYVELVNAGPDTEPARLKMMLAQRAKVLAQLAELTAALGTLDYKITVYG